MTRKAIYAHRNDVPLPKTKGANMDSMFLPNYTDTSFLATIFA